MAIASRLFENNGQRQSESSCVRRNASAFGAVDTQVYLRSGYIPFQLLSSSSDRFRLLEIPAQFVNLSIIRHIKEEQHRSTPQAVVPIKSTTRRLNHHHHASLEPWRDPRYHSQSTPQDVQCHLYRTLQDPLERKMPMGHRRPICTTSRHCHRYSQEHGDEASN